MTQPPPGPWRPSGPLPPPRARPLPPQPPQPIHRPTASYPTPGPQGPPAPRGPVGPPQYGPPPRYGPPQFPTGYRPPAYPPPGAPPGSTAPPWLQGYPGHPGMLRPRPKSNTGPLLATIIVAIMVVGAGMVGLVAVSARGNHVADTGYDEPPATSGETTTTVTTTTDATVTTTDAPVTTTQNTPTETTPAGPQPVYELADNPLFAGEVPAPPVSCTLRRWQTSPAGAKAFFKSALPCLDAAWQPVLEQAGLPFATPSLEFPEGTNWSSPCGQVAGGEGAAAAFYCGENNTMYMPFAGLQTDLYGARPGVYLALFAHEYGHHVQALSGVLDTYAQARYEAGADTGPGLELSRRLELQAQCFSGMFLAATNGRGSVNANIMAEARGSQDRGDHNPGRPRDHGTDAHTSAWWEQGAQKNRTFQCNTWKSPAKDVA